MEIGSGKVEAFILGKVKAFSLNVNGKALLS